jgi:hypothetical protein
MASIKSICNTSILLHNGKIDQYGITDEVINTYLRGGTTNTEQRLSFTGPLTKNITINRITVNNANESYLEIFPSNPINVRIEGICVKEIEKFRLSFSIFTDNEIRVFTVHDADAPEKLKTGEFISEFNIPAYFLRPGIYCIAVGGHNGDHLRPGADWMFGTNLVTIKILTEYNLQYDFANTGLINVPFIGGKKLQPNGD